ncbi:hypothetical protein PspLS_03058 [Pyricularia sp. CBS 133598]|nr:hypothetical protein PspLS_03058 [Pyricularia sp. CBS 133598]
MRKSNSATLPLTSGARTPRLRPTHPPESPIEPLDLVTPPKTPVLQPLRLDDDEIPELDIGKPMMACQSTPPPVFLSPSQLANRRFTRQTPGGIILKV